MSDDVMVEESASRQADPARSTKGIRPFRAEFLIGQLILITERDFKILVENGAHTLPHDFDYESLERIADQFLGETVVLNVVNGKITKMKPF